jgi:SAM-dependent methyltransferase
MKDRPIAYEAWEELAEAYSAKVETKAHNALYERPATLSLLPEVKGLRVLDAGCGPGVTARWLIEHGAEVVGFDASPKMVRLARKRVGDSAQILQGDLGKPLDFLEDISFDVILSSLVLSYVPDWRPIFKEFFRLLRPSGLLVFSSGHPFDDFYRFLDRANYFEVERIEETWRGFGFEVVIPFYRRSLSEMINPLIAAGFLLDKILEPRPLPEFKDRDPEDYDKLMKQPGFICIRAKKPPNP